LLFIEHVHVMRFIVKQDKQVPINYESEFPNSLLPDWSSKP
jgi:hypothetical protein